MPENRTSSDRPVWLAIIFIVAVLVAAGTAFLLHIARANPADTLTGAGMAFVATVTLCMAISRFLAS